MNGMLTHCQGKSFLHKSALLVFKLPNGILFLRETVKCISVSYPRIRFIEAIVFYISARKIPPKSVVAKVLAWLKYVLS